MALAVEEQEQGVAAELDQRRAEGIRLSQQTS